MNGHHVGREREQIVTTNEETVPGKKAFQPTYH
jgi:hypothetical protein